MRNETINQRRAGLVPLLAARCTGSAPRTERSPAARGDRSGHERPPAPGRARPSRRSRARPSRPAPPSAPRRRREARARYLCAAPPPWSRSWCRCRSAAARQDIPGWGGRPGGREPPSSAARPLGAAYLPPSAALPAPLPPAPRVGGGAAAPPRPAERTNTAGRGSTVPCGRTHRPRRGGSGRR